MCLRSTDVRPVNRWNWDGDLIVPDTTILARRPNPATQGRYKVDIREFVSTSSNAILHDTLDTIFERLTPDEQRLFRSRKKGSFDLRARAITAHLGRTIAYTRRNRASEFWLFPDETLDAGRGDCEDLAFLVAALLIASGVSGYAVRVALGTFQGVGSKEPNDHAWVVYRDENGRWLLLEPLLFTKDAATAPERDARPRKRASRFQYEPRFVFNDSHLWAMKPARGVVPIGEYTSRRDFWQEFDPAFAASVHSKLVDEALAGMSAAGRGWVKAVSLALDGDTFAYHPADHFDNGYIGAGFDRVRDHVKTGNLTDFACAVHAIADFYAHSSYGHFAILPDGTLPPVDEQTAGEAPAAGTAPDYRTGDFAFTREGFTRNEEHASLPKGKAGKHWAGKWISGRYAQRDDAAAGAAESYLTPYPNELAGAAEIGPRACLPHHNEIAVDAQARSEVPEGHVLYAGDLPKYRAQFKARRDAASAHIANAYRAWRRRGFDA